eukprot:COSAG01_NODE_1_length_100484_cov_170.446142_75_plen_103_part_00
MKKLRKRIYKGSARRPRLKIFRSNKFIYAQIIDDEKHHTITSASSLKLKEKGAKAAELTALKLSESLKKSEISEIVFDRGKYLYRGCIKLFIEKLRESNIKV